MITKRDYANHVVIQFMNDNNITSREDLNRYVMSSTSLGIALEYLGELDEGYKDYIASRGGIAIAVRDDAELRILSTRELMNLLPEDL